MKTDIFRSNTDPRVFVALADEVREHLRRHFDGALPGSKFCFATPDELLQLAVDRFPSVIAGATPDADGIKVVSLCFEGVIGTSNVVPVDLLTDDERATLRTVPRGETLARCASSQRVFPTCECQLIMDNDNNLITAYPGEAAPPLPPTPDISDPYWDHHVFIVQ